jgi:hypothetical protein
LEVFVNPRIAREKSYDNNLIVLPEYLNVLSDNAHPVIDVTFDGRYLQNNEFVSANPSILIRLWDENPFMKKRDTLGVSIFLSYPCDDGDCDYERIYFSREDISWKPADASSDFQIHFSPADLISGSYRLRVHAADASGNASDGHPFEIGFRVAHEASVLANPPYPNPFYLETNFDIVVTGAQSPGYFYTIQIADLNGKRVAEFADPANGLHVGKNTLRWNGLDENGNSLPNGIYIYRLTIGGGISPQEYNGKIVLLR